MCFIPAVPQGNAAELRCPRAVPVCCRSPGKREVPTQVFLVEIAGGAGEELTVAVLGVGRGKRESGTNVLGRSGGTD